VETAPNVRIMAPMKTQEPHQELPDAFEPAPPPLMGVDGAPLVQPQRADPPPRPSLCTAGPCRRYHRLVTQVAAAEPGAVRLPIHLPAGTPGALETEQGTIYRAPAAFYVQTHHYCYPDTGIEMPLHDLPVVECNRWDPGGDPNDRGRRSREIGFHLDRVAEWEAERAAEATQAATVDAQITAALIAAPLMACQGCGLRFPESELDIKSLCTKCRGTTTTTKDTP